MCSGDRARLKAGATWQEHDLVFCTTIGTHLSSSRTFFEQFKDLLKKAGLPDVRFHDLRHSSASMLLSIGVHPKVVQEILGHSHQQAERRAQEVKQPFSRFAVRRLEGVVLHRLYRPNEGVGGGGGI
jgi:integrase